MVVIMTKMQVNQNIPIGGRLLTDEEAAQSLGLKNAGTLPVWRSTKRHPELVYIRVGRNVRYSEEAVEKFKRLRSVGVMSD
jgi:hypothetical protein